jgi:hypothetical protein
MHVWKDIAQWALVGMVVLGFLLVDVWQDMHLDSLSDRQRRGELQANLVREQIEAAQSDLQDASFELSEAAILADKRWRVPDLSNTVELVIVPDSARRSRLLAEQLERWKKRMASFLFPAAYAGT